MPTKVEHPRKFHFRDKKNKQELKSEVRNRKWGTSNAPPASFYRILFQQ